jgi:hypothetical protein
MFGEKYFKPWYLVFICKKLFIAIIFFGLEWSFKYSKNSMVSSKLCYLKQCFYMLAKHLTIKNTMVLSQIFKNTLFQTPPVFTFPLAAPTLTEPNSKFCPDS